MTLTPIRTVTALTRSIGVARPSLGNVMATNFRTLRTNPGSSPLTISATRLQMGSGLESLHLGSGHLRSGHPLLSMKLPLIHLSEQQAITPATRHTKVNPWIAPVIIAGPIIASIVYMFFANDHLPTFDSIQMADLFKPSQLIGSMLMLGIAVVATQTNTIPDLNIKLKNEDAYIRAEAARKLGIIGSEDTLKLLTINEQGINDPVWMVRAGAAEGLAINGSSTALRILTAHIFQDEQFKVTINAIIALGQSHSPLAHELLIDLAKQADTTWQVYSFESLAQVKSDIVFQVLSEALTNPDPQIRKYAALGIARRGTHEAVYMVSNRNDALGLYDSKISVREKTVLGLGEAGTNASIAMLSIPGFGFNSINEDIRYWAAFGIGKSGTDTAVCTLIELLNHHNNDEIFQGICEGICLSEKKDYILEKLEQEAPEIYARVIPEIH